MRCFVIGWVIIGLKIDWYVDRRLLRLHEVDCWGRLRNESKIDFSGAIYSSKLIADSHV